MIYFRECVKTISITEMSPMFVLTQLGAITAIFCRFLNDSLRQIADNQSFYFKLPLRANFSQSAITRFCPFST